MSQPQEPLPKAEDHTASQAIPNNTDTNAESTVSNTTTNETAATEGEHQSGETTNDVQQLADRIQIKIKDNSHKEVWFEVRRTTPLGMVMREYCKAIRHDKTALKFFYDGERVLDDTTPAYVGAP